MTFTGIPPVGDEQDFEKQVDQDTKETDSGRRSDTFYDSFASPFQDKGLFSTPEGMGVMVFGVLLPGMLLGAAALACCDRITLMLLKHPLETIIQIVLAALVPIANYVIWKSLSRDDRRFAKRRGIMNGIAIGTASLIAVIGWAAVILHYPAVDESSGNPHPGAFTSIAVIASLAASTAIYLANALRTSRELRSSQLRTVLYSVIGVIFSAHCLRAPMSQIRCILYRYAHATILLHLTFHDHHLLGENRNYCNINFQQVPSKSAEKKKC